jgi:hypothetical protein
MAMHREGIEMPRSLSRMLEAIKMVEDGKCNHSAKGKKCPVHGMDECSGMYETSTINGKVQDPKSLRWKQTSMSYEEAVKKYGKDKVRKDSKDRAGDEIVKVHVPLGEGKPSAGMTKGEKSAVVKKAKAGGDIGKPGKSFDKVAKAAGGGEKGKKIAAAAMWKNAAK